MGLTRKQKNILRNRLENVVDKIKSLIRNDQGFPSSEDVNNWFTEMLPIDIKQDKPAQIWTSLKTKKIEVLFFCNDEMIHLLLKYSSAFYTQAYIEFYSDIIFISDLDPNNFIMTGKIRRNLRRKFNIN